MAKVFELTRNQVVESSRALGQYCLTALRNIALMAGSVGSLVIIGAWLLLLIFPIFLFVGFMLKLLGF